MTRSPQQIDEGKWDVDHTPEELHHANRLGRIRLPSEAIDGEKGS
jgi:hypothetical protein